MQLPLIASPEPSPPPPLEIIGTQGDIRYYDQPAKGVLNSPESTGMPFWSINPYVGCAFGCTYCYARYAHRYALDRAISSSSPGDALRDEIESMPPWLAFERHVLIKENAAAVLGQELRPGGARLAALKAGEVVVVGTATDPYQPAERRFRITRGVLETLAEHAGLSIVIITKSPLITRDVDVLRRIADRSELTIHLSLITMRRDLARLIEPRAPTPGARIRALARLRRADIDVGINVMPVLPGITDAATAQAALPKLREANAQLGEIATLANSLNPERKGALAKLITAAAPAIDQMCDKVLAMPGVGDVAKPTIDELRRKIAALSQA